MNQVLYVLSNLLQFGYFDSPVAAAVAKVSLSVLHRERSQHRWQPTRPQPGISRVAISLPMHEKWTVVLTALLLIEKTDVLTLPITRQCYGTDHIYIFLLYFNKDGKSQIAT